MTLASVGATVPEPDDQPAPRPAPACDVSVVLPCLNEESSVGACVTEALDAISAAGLTGEVVVVDNGSSDASAERAVAAGARVVAEATPGYGAAIRRGITEATGTVVVMADADATYPLDRLVELVTPVLHGEADMMVGSRLHAATRQSMPLLHRFVGTPVLTWLVREGTGASGLSDSQSGFRAFRVDTVDRLGLRSTGMEFASEMLIRAAQQGLDVREVPLGYRDRVGESKLDTWSDGWRHLRLIIRLSPQILLWKPGLAMALLAVIVYAVPIIWPRGIPIGSTMWQPVFLGTILLVLGTLAALSGALLARNSPSASTATRLRFAWVDDPRFLRWGIRGSLLVTLAGVVLEMMLFVTWVAMPDAGPQRRIALAGLAQGLLLTGMIGAAVLVVYRLTLNDSSSSPAVPGTSTPIGSSRSSESPRP